MSKGVDRILVTGYVWRTINTGGSASPTSFANAVHAAILGGIPITHVRLQNEPDGRPQDTDGNAPPSVVDDTTVQLTGTIAQGLQNQLVSDMTELRNRLNTLGHQVGGSSPVVVIGLEWAHFGSNGETEYNILNAAGAIPSIVGVGAGHCYKDCPANGLYDSRWLQRGLPLWSRPATPARRTARRASSRR